MMRSTTNSRVLHDATVKFETGGGVVPPFDARAVNLSVGGMFVNAPTLLAPGVQVDLQVSLRDGKSPVHTRGEVIRVQDGGEDERGMALRFVDLGADAERRIERVVELRSREPTGHGSRREMRIRLPSLPAPLRAVARDQTDRGLMLEAELPWLTLGSEIVAELTPDRAVEGTVRWVGLDVTRAGHARLRIFVEVAGDDRPEVAPLPPAPSMTGPVASLPAPARARSPFLMAVGVAGIMAITAGATALILRAPQPPAVLALPAAEPYADPIAPAAHTPPTVAVPQAKAAADATAATPHKHRRTARKRTVE